MECDIYYVVYGVWYMVDGIGHRYKICSIGDGNWHMVNGTRYMVYTN